jgi:transcriptional regulator with XRE-family HTH domain
MMTTLCERLGIEIPIIQAPVGGTVGPALAAAVSSWRPKSSASPCQTQRLHRQVIAAVRSSRARTGRACLRSACRFLAVICRLFGRDVADAPVYGRVVKMSTSMSGDTMAEGFGRMRPDGAKIVELRKRRGLKQEVLAEKARISVRQLGEIERTSQSVHATTITAIATALGATPREITLSTPDETPEKFRNAHPPQARGHSICDRVGPLGRSAGRPRLPAES